MDRVFDEIGPAGFGSSYWRRWLVCPFKAWAHEHGYYQEPKSDAFALGQAVHVAESHHYIRLQAKQQGTNPDEWMEPIPAIGYYARTGKTDPLTPSQVADAGALYEGCTHSNRRKIVSVEEVYAVELGNIDCPGHPRHGEPYLYRTRVDLVDDHNGYVWFGDHKTDSAPSHSTVEAYANDFQFIMMAVLGRAWFGDKFAGVRLHLIDKERYSSEWFDLDINKFQVEAILWTMQEAAQRKARLELEVMQGRDPMTLPRVVSQDVCKGRYSICRAMDVCKRGTTERPKMPRRVRK